MNTQNSTALVTGTVAPGIGHNNPPADVAKLTDAQKDAIDKAMRSLATQLEGVVDTEVNNLIVEIETHRKEAAVGPFRVLRWAMDHIPAEKLAMFPTPGTDWQTSGQPDKYDEVYYRDGKKHYRKTSFYLQFFLKSFPEGKRIAAELAHIAVAKDDKANHAAVPAAIMAMNPVDLESYREDLVARQNSGVKAIRDAFALMKQFDGVNALPGVSAEPLMDKDGNVQKISKPIKVWNVENKDVEWSLYSISGFMQFDPATAAEKGGTFAALKLTAKREQSEDEDGDPATSDAPVVINTNKTFAARLNDLAEFVDNKLMSDPKRDLLTQFIKDHVNGAGSDDLVYNINELKLFADYILNIPAVQTRLETIQRMKNAA